MSEEKVNPFVAAYLEKRHDTPVERWEAIGFLDGVKDEEKRERMAVEFDRLAKYVLYSEWDYNVHVECVIFPTIRKVLEKGELIRSYNPKLLCDEAKHVLDYLAIKLSEDDYGIDMEAEATRVLYEMFRRPKTLKEVSNIHRRPVARHPSPPFPPL